MGNVPDEIYIEQDLKGNLFSEFWNFEPPLVPGIALLHKYHHDRKYQKAIEALKKLFSEYEVATKEAANFMYKTLKELGEINE